MAFIVAIHPDGTEVEIRGQSLRDLLLRAREWVRRHPWSPNTETDDGSVHPQLMAYESKAHIVGYGGAAGGGKTDLACGLTLTRHRKVMILRRVGTELQGILDRLEELIGNTDGRNGQLKVWKRKRFDGVAQQIEWASLPNAGDERGFQGRPHDLLIFDEAANFLEGQVRFLLGWLRSTVKGQQKKCLLAFNPPTSAEGRWIIGFFGPWLDETHNNPALPGELRWFATIAGEDVEVPDDRRFVLFKELADGERVKLLDRPPEHRVYDFNPKLYRGKERNKIIEPLSRTFIPSRVTDNPFLANTGYLAMLQGLPEPLRSQMLYGDFKAGMVDDAWQVIPTAWVEAAMKRWKPKLVLPEMDSLGIDVARGGDDKTVLSPRHDNWFAEMQTYPGKATPDGHHVATLAVMACRDHAPIHIDVIGVGSSPYDVLKAKDGVQVIGVNVSESPTRMDRTGLLTYANLRTQLWWEMREALDPTNNQGWQLPPDPELLGDLTAPVFKVRGRTIYVESKDEVMKRIGRSPDKASALMLAQIETPKLAVLRGARIARESLDYSPYDRMR